MSDPGRSGPRLPSGALSAVNLSLLVLVVAAVASRGVLDGPERELDIGASLARFARGFWPPDLSVLGDLGGALRETFEIALWATILAAFLALPLAALGVPRLLPRPLAHGAHFLLAVIRTIPSLLWALLAVAVVGPIPLAGVAALTLYSLGYLGTFALQDSASLDTSRATFLATTGMSRFQRFLYGVWPEVKPLLTSRVVWMLEYNVRSAAIIGYVGAGGIGARLYEYQEFGQWNRFATVLLVLLVAVLLLDFWGRKLRARLAPGELVGGE